MLNIHTHKLPADPSEPFVLNCNIGEVPVSVERCSVGLHPWKVDAEWRDMMPVLRRDVILPNVVAIGECGLDGLRGGDMNMQVDAFCAQIQLSEEVGKPLIIHCVRKFDLLLQLHKKYNPRQLWIVHGFRGKPELAMRLTKAGIRLSFGEKFNPESLKAVVSAGSSFYIETDEADLSLSEVQASVQKHISRQS